jgi:hypothetical protein
MGKIVIKSQGNPAGEVNLKLGDTMIGRDPRCDIVLKNDKSVSKKHAVIRTVGTKSTIEDLGSTNGTFIDNQIIKRHELRRGDTIIIGEHELVYRDDISLDTTPYGGSTAFPAAAPDASQEKTKIITSYAQLIATEGKNRGKRIPLVKEETLIDNPGKSPARLFRGPDGYVLHAQIGPGEPRLNDKPVPPGGQLLESGDVIEIAGTKYQILI